MSAQPLSDRLADVVAEFTALTEQDRLQLLVEFGAEVPDLPERYRDRLDLFEAVAECQSPVYVLAELEGDPDPVVRLHVSAPPQAPVTRGFAGVLHTVLDGAAAREVAELPADVGARLGLDSVVSPLRLRGMAGMLERVRRQVAAAAG